MFEGARKLLGNPLIKLLAINAAAGTTAAAVAVAALLYTDPHGIATLILESSNPVLPIALLFAGFTITLAAVAMGVAVMTLPYDRDYGTGRGLGVEAVDEDEFEPMLVPVPVRKNEPRTLGR